MRTEYVTTDPGVPRELTQRVEVAPRQVDSLRDVNLVVVDHAQALDQANEQLTAIDCILFPENPIGPRACGSDENQN